MLDVPPQFLGENSENGPYFDFHVCSEQVQGFFEDLDLFFPWPSDMFSKMMQLSNSYHTLCTCQYAYYTCIYQTSTVGLRVRSHLSP